MNFIEIYTDGSCHTQTRDGGWAAILIVGDEKVVLSGAAGDTTHNRMELTAVIQGLEYVLGHYGDAIEIHVISDSQYVVGLTGREGKLAARHFTTKKGIEIKNADLVKELLKLAANHSIRFIKIKAHQKKGGIADFNIEADKLSRKLVRDK